MKKLLFLSAIIAGTLNIQTAKAQIGIHINLNLGPRPVYAQAPAPVEDDYYYLPDAEAYYSVPEQVYYYQYEGRWISSPRLAGQYRDYDYSRMRHYEIKESRPYLRNDFYRSRYNNPQIYAGNNGNYRNQNYSRSFDRGDYRRQEDHYDRGDFRGRNDERDHDHDNHNDGYRR